MASSAATRSPRPVRRPPVPNPRAPPRAASLSGSTSEGREAVSAGRRPKMAPVAIESRKANPSTRPSTAMLPRSSSSVALMPHAAVRSGRMADRSSVAQRAKSTPRTPPATARSVLSVSSCLTSRPRPAPRATRIAISRSRPEARAMRRLATLTHAMSSTRPTAPSRMSIDCLTTGSLRASSSGTAMAPPTPPLDWGGMCASCTMAPAAATSDRAWASVTPGRSRPIASNQ